MAQRQNRRLLAASEQVRESGANIQRHSNREPSRNRSLVAAIRRRPAIHEILENENSTYPASAAPVSKYGLVGPRLFALHTSARRQPRRCQSLPTDDGHRNLFEKSVQR